VFEGPFGNLYHLRIRVQNFLRRYIAVIGCITTLSCVLVAQSSSNDSDFQSWNDLQITVPLTKKLDLYTVTTIQFGGNLTNVDNTRFAAGVTVKPTKRFSITPYLLVLSDRNSNNEFRYEYRFSLRGVYKRQFEHFGLSHRSQLEYRIRPGRNTWRYRPSVTVEKALPERFVRGLKAFVTEEPFYDSASGRFSRNRLSAGVSKKLNEKLSLDIYFLRQGDNFNKPGTVNVLGTAWKLSL
jgi:hypothetical protein